METDLTHNRHCSGRPHTTTAEGRQEIVETAVHNCRKQLGEIGNKSEASVSCDTICRVLANEDYHQHVAKKVPYLSKATEKWLTWPKEHKNWTAEWDNVAWSDDWDVLKKHLWDCKDHPSTYNEPCDAIFDIWDKIDCDEIDRYIG